MAISDCLASCEPAAGPLLAACQGHSDKQLCTRQSYKLAAKMAADGKELNEATRCDAVGAGLVALQLWREGKTIERDGVADVVANDHDTTTDHRNARQVSWQAIVASVAADQFGETDAQQAAAVDWVEWLKLNGAGATAADLLASWRIDRRRARRLSLVDTMRDGLAAGRGRRGALADKVKHAAVLLISGMSADDAATAAGFKASAGGKSGGGKVKAADRLASALRRAGFPVLNKRGNWGQDMDDFQQAKRRGGAAVDLASQFKGWPSLPAEYVKPVGAVAVPDLHPLDKAQSGLPFEVCGESARRLASPRSVLAVAGASLQARRRRGVLRSLVVQRGGQVPALRDAVGLPVAVAVAIPDGARRSAHGWQSGEATPGNGSQCWSRVIGRRFVVSPDGDCRADNGGVLLMSHGACLGFKA